MSGWPWRWSTGTPVEDGTFLACWVIDGEPNYALVHWFDKWHMGDLPEAPHYWQRITSPFEDMQLMNEYEKQAR